MRTSGSDLPEQEPSHHCVAGSSAGLLDRCGLLLEPQLSRSLLGHILDLDVQLAEAHGFHDRADHIRQFFLGGT